MAESSGMSQSVCLDVTPPKGMKVTAAKVVGANYEGRRLVVDIELKPIVKYRDVDEGDIGQQVRVRNSDLEDWRTFKLIAVLPGDYSGRFIVGKCGSSWEPFEYCEIVDDGKPRPRVHYGVLNGNHALVFDTLPYAETVAARTGGHAVVKITEVHPQT